MKKSFYLLSLLFSLFCLSACVTTSLEETPDGMAVNIVENKPAGCESLGDLDTTGWHMTRDEAINYLRNKTVREGGDTLRISKSVNFSYGGMVIGSNDYYGHKAYMYKCKK